MPRPTDPSPRRAPGSPGLANLAPALCLLTLALTLLTAGCKKDRLPGDRLEFLPLPVGIPAGLNPILSHTFEFADVSTEHARFEQEFDVSWDAYARIEPARASLTITEPGLDWSFADEVIIRIVPDSGQVREVFYRDQIPRNVGARLDLIPTDLDASDLLAGERVTIQVVLERLNAAPPQSLPVLMTWSFEGRR